MTQNLEIQVSVSARTDAGMKRPANEDAFLVADLTTGRSGLGPEVSTHTMGERGSLLIVSDGLGGAAAGEVASELTVKTILEKLSESPLDADVSASLMDAITAANQRIWKHAREYPEHAGLGATSTAVLVRGTSAYIAQVGDSRAYLARGSRIKQITKDQSYAQLLLDSGAITQEQAVSVPKNIIMQALGTSPTVRAAMTLAQLNKGDILILCSDGLSNKVESDEMLQAVRESPSLSDACRRLIDMANERGGEDNITIVAARFEGEALRSAADGAAITGTFQALETASYSDDVMKTAADYSSRLAEQRAAAIKTGVFSAPSIDASVANTNDEDDRDEEKDDEAFAARGSGAKVVITALLVLLALSIYLVYHYFLKQ